MTTRRLACCVFFAALALGCEKQLGPERVPTIPVHGQVLVDGQPAKDVRVTFHAISQKPGEESVYTAAPNAMTDEQGQFQISTYVQGDGVAEGTYKITFAHLHFDAFRNLHTGPDKLGGRYANPEKSTFEAVVTPDSDILELEPFQLESKSKR